jgi:hypothetical protein
MDMMKKIRFSLSFFSLSLSLSLSLSSMQSSLKAGIPYCYWDEWQHVLLITGCGEVV